MAEEIKRLEEDKHFYERDRELIEKLRTKAAEERQEAERKHRKELHWMKCPKCGHDLTETQMGPLTVDKCKHCGGVFFDNGELDLLLAHEKEGSFIKRLFGK